MEIGANGMRRLETSKLVLGNLNVVAANIGWSEHAGGERAGRYVGKYSITLKMRGLSLMRGSRGRRHSSLNTGTMLAMMIEREAAPLLPALEVGIV